MIEFDDPSPIATPKQYRDALLAVRDSSGISPLELAMLEAHYKSPSHTITSTQLAEKAQLSNYSIANLNYGKLAHRIADQLHYRPGDSSVEGAEHWWRTLAYGKDASPEMEIKHYRWVMRPELVRALEEMGWVK
jgi:hypothetical protein